MKSEELDKILEEDDDGKTGMMDFTLVQEPALDMITYESIDDHNSST